MWRMTLGLSVASPVACFYCIWRAWGLAFGVRKHDQVWCGPVLNHALPRWFVLSRRVSEPPRDSPAKAVGASCEVASLTSARCLAHRKLVASRRLRRVAPAEQTKRATNRLVN